MVLGRLHFAHDVTLVAVHSIALLTLLTLTYFTPQFGREDLVQRRAILLLPFIQHLG
jgi:hypothetical protein